MDKVTQHIKNHNNLDSNKVFYHGSSKSVVDALESGEMDVNKIFHVTDDPMVAAAYAGAKGSVLIIASNNREFGVQSRISQCISSHINGANQWVMDADEANEMLDEAEAVLAAPVWAIRQI